MPSTQELSDSLVERQVIEAPGGLAGRRIEFPGLSGTIADVLVRVQSADGNTTTMLARPSQPWMEIPASPGSAIEIAGAFVGHGIEHILLGYDHLLFVLALMIIVRSTRALVWTITAFTLAHSITLALATLGLVHVPGPPVEAAIAFSILLLASEIVRLRRGESSRPPGGHGSSRSRSDCCTASGSPVRCRRSAAAYRHSARALRIQCRRGTGSARLHRLPCWVSLRSCATLRLTRPMAERAMRLAPYAIGSLAALWFIERVAAFAT